jgi:hypothetical protein
MELSPQIKKAANAAFFWSRAKFLGSGLGAVFLTELVYATGSIHNLLGTGIKRMAFGAHFDMQGWFAHHGLGLEGVTATASYGEFLVVWMDICFHDFFPYE